MAPLTIFKLVQLIVGSALIAGLVLCKPERFDVSKKQVTLEDICTNNQVAITSVAEFERLLKELLKDDKFEKCPNRYRQAFTQLEPIVLDTKMPVCGEAKFDLVREYHFRFVNPKQEVYEFGDNLDNLNKKIVPRRIDENPIEFGVLLDDYNQEASCPIALQQFFKAYALQMSGLCKESLIENIDQGMNLMNDADHVLFQMIKFKPDGVHVGTMQTSETGTKADPQVAPMEPKSELASLLVRPSKFQYGLNFRQLVYMPELEGELERGDLERSKQVVQLDLRDKPDLNKFMKSCEHRYRPVYSKLVLPIVRLAKLGYDYAGRELDRYGDKLKSDTIMTWLMITLTCESHGKIKLVEEEEEDEDKRSQEDEDEDERIEDVSFLLQRSRVIDGDLWIKGASQLAEEFRNSNAHKLRGFQKFLYDSSLVGRKVVAALDPNRSAFYRRNSNTISTGLNGASILTTFVSMAISLGWIGPG